jgi:hypothetical protein
LYLLSICFWLTIPCSNSFKSPTRISSKNDLSLNKFENLKFSPILYRDDDYAALNKNINTEIRTEISFLLEENKCLAAHIKELEHGIVNQKHIDNKYKKLEKLLANRNYIDELNKRAVTD